MEGQRIIDKVKKALKQVVPANSTVVAAVSGGADSMALADGLARLRQECCFSVYIVHVEHGLRGSEALRDAELVRNFCLAKDLPFCCRHVDVRAYSEKAGISIEDAARKLRYRELEEKAASVGADYILTAHHSDDQAETVLLKLLRGAGAAGLSGMEISSGRLLRPFLQLDRQELEAYCLECGIKYCHDSSNDDVHYTRNRVRLQLLPYLKEKFNPAVKKALLQTAALLQEDEAFFARLTEREFAARAERYEDGLRLNTQEWQSIAPSVRKRLLRRAYFAAGGFELGYRHTEALDKLCLRNRSGQRLQLPQKFQGVYAYGWLYLSVGQIVRKPAAAAEILLTVENGAAADTEAGRVQLQLLRKKPALQGNNIIYPAAALACGSITIRARKNGDRFRPYGSSGSKKLKDYFIDRKIPRQQRDEKLLACSGSTILGIFGVANGAWEPGEYDLWLNIVLTEKEQNNE